MTYSIWEKIFGAVTLIFVVAVALLTFFVMFWIFPNQAIAERKCLQAGYPKTSIDYTGAGYCINLEGSVRVRVEELP